MDVFQLIRKMQRQAPESGGPDIFVLLEEELAGGLELFWETATGILKDSGIQVQSPSRTVFSLENNFFSLLFLYSYYRCAVPGSRRQLYAAVNHCLRGMVTGCDNILDSEYKQTLATDLPEGATRFRSVLDIMVADRVLFEILLQRCRAGDITYEQVADAVEASLQVLTRSGAQEASEECGVSTVLAPHEVIERVHHYKTGLLFLCPWGVPAVLEELEESAASPVQQALYRVGIGCQIMDDMVDLGHDVIAKRHNYIASLVYHDLGHDAYAQLTVLADAGEQGQAANDLPLQFPAACRSAAAQAHHYLEEGLHALFTHDHRVLVEPSIRFLCRRIGTERYMGLPGT